MLEELTVTAWQYFGHDRLYVNLPDGTPIGWADRRTGGITVVHARYRDDVTDALARRAPELLTRAEPQVFVHPGALADTDTDTDGDGDTYADVYADGDTYADVYGDGDAYPRGDAYGDGDTYPRGEAYADAVGPAAAGGATEAHRTVVAPPAASAWGLPEPAGTGPSAGHGPGDRLPRLTPENDLASRRPGATLRANSSSGDSAAPDSGRLERLSSRLLRRRPMDEARRKELLGERRTGAELGRLTRHGWRVLHSIPLADGADIDHLLIGPGGVFTVRTEYHPQQSVRADDDTVRIDDGDPRPYIAECRAEAALVRKVLASYCDFPVRVQPVLVFVDAASLDVAATQTDVRVYRERQVSALAPLAGELTAHEADRIYDVARLAEVWQEV
ncbi:nuclease-related domain-containing protein [Streptomyces sp. Tu 2975]|uniref:nuclease-related domain-containing protein n=1 Tax=Streptomyces sp. Tu 2975 TaxID=2676871 RepID=UPI001FC94250|nr:nuclease-related domain-containing protein [Streptomyces sp. Tu 2975]